MFLFRFSSFASTAFLTYSSSRKLSPVGVSVRGTLKGMSETPDTFRYFWSTPDDVESKCIFCKIANGSMKPGSRKNPTELIYESDHLVAFDDIQPGASHRHLLVVTKAHIKNCWDPKLTMTLLNEMDHVANELLQRFNNNNNNNNPPTNETAAVAGGLMTRKFFIRPPFNSVYHIHLHVMIGRLIDPVWHPRRLGFENSWFHITPDQLKKERTF